LQIPTPTFVSFVAFSKSFLAMAGVIWLEERCERVCLLDNEHAKRLIDDRVVTGCQLPECLPLNAWMAPGIVNPLLMSGFA
jgi:hypothetical protein